MLVSRQDHYFLLPCLWRIAGLPYLGLRLVLLQSSSQALPSQQAISCFHSQLLLQSLAAVSSVTKFSALVLGACYTVQPALLCGQVLFVLLLNTTNLLLW